MNFFQLICNMTIPITMIIAGFMGVFTPTAKSMKDVGKFTGYRSKRSMKTVETWNFANYNAGIAYLFIGFYMIFATGVICAIIAYFKFPYISAITIVIVLIQLIIFILPVFSIEKKLETYFDNIGRPLKPEKIFKRRFFSKGYKEPKEEDDNWEDWNKDEWRDTWREEWDDWDLWEKHQKERKEHREKIKKYEKPSENIIEDAAIEDFEDFEEREK